MLLVVPVGVEHKADRYPVVTFSLMGACVAIFLLMHGEQHGPFNRAGIQAPDYPPVSR